MGLILTVARDCETGLKECGERTIVLIDTRGAA